MDSQTSQIGNTLDTAMWVDRHGDTLFRYALSRLRDHDSAEEVVQETFVAALRAIDQYTGAGSEGAWLLGILKRKIIDCVRRRNRLDAVVWANVGEAPTETLFDKHGNWRFDPRMAGLRSETSLERKEFWHAFRECLTRLPQRQADVFAPQEMEGLSGKDICKELQITQSNLWSNLWVLLHRARLRLVCLMKAHFEA